MNFTMYRRIIKPLLDKLLSLVFLIVFSPLFIFIAITLLILNNGKVFFIQERVGEKERVFKLLKFKTMNDKKDNDGNLLNDEKRLTHIGKILRKTSMDELPQLINVLRGDMSLIGPRPLLVEYLPLYNEFQRRRHEVKPGITGWAQVNGRNALDWKKKFEYDVWYVDNMSLLLDLKIIFLTIIKVFKREGISSQNSATMEKFKGNNL